MRCLAINYDLRKQGKNYDLLYEKIKSLGSWCHCLDSMWLVATQADVHSACNTIKPALDGDDFLLILDVTGDSQQGWLPKTMWNWINKHIDPNNIWVR